MSAGTTKLPELSSTRQRIDVIDALRGFALLGILVMNIQIFSMPEQAYLNPLVFGTTDASLSGSDGWVYIITHLLADQKFLTIFSLLFGVSMALMAESRPHNATRYIMRRNFFLLLIGLGHAYLIWSGDILVTYALCGFAVVWLRNLSALKLFVAGLILFLIPIVMNLLDAALLPYWTIQDYAELTAIWQPGAVEISAQIEDMRGSWLQQMEYRISSALGMQTVVFLSETAWRVSGLMLWGMALYKVKFFQSAVLTWRHGLLLFVVFLTGLSIVAFGIQQNIQNHWQAHYSLLVGHLYNYVGSVFVSATYIGMFVWLSRKKNLSAIMSVFQTIGRTALSNYLFQSLVCTLIFYGHGLGLFASLDRFQVMLLLPFVWIAQIILSGLWLSHYRNGPVEWAWRSAVQGKILPIAR